MSKRKEAPEETEVPKGLCKVVSPAEVFRWSAIMRARKDKFSRDALNGDLKLCKEIIKINPRDSFKYHVVLAESGDLDSQLALAKRHEETSIEFKYEYSRSYADAHLSIKYYKQIIETLKKE